MILKKTKLLFSKLPILIIAILLCIVLVACDDTQPFSTKKTITFLVENDNGYIVGESTQKVKKNSDTQEVYVMPNFGYRFVSWSNGSTSNPISFKVEEDTTLTAILEETDSTYPVISINTENNAAIDSKENWVKCSISTSYTDEEYQITDAEAKIKGRGNSTWGMPKKPYKFKFSSKTDMFGMGKAKNWVLLANYCDPSSLRNGLAFSIGKTMKEIKKETSDYIFVEVVLNGEYLGVYQLCEQIEVHSKRVNIDDDTTKEDTGYILELDFRIVNEGIEDVDYFVVNGRYYAVKDPDPDDTLTQDQMTFIKDYVSKANTALYSSDYNEILKYIDVDTFAASYIVEELFNNVDVGGASFYLYKDAGGKLCSGPIWDFDISAGNSDYVPSAINPNTIYAGSANEWYRELLKYKDFKDLVASKLEKYEDDIIDAIENVTDSALQNIASYERNYLKWQTIGIYVWPNSQDLVDIKTWEGQVEYVKTWLLDSLEYLIDYYVVSEE